MVSRFGNPLIPPSFRRGRACAATLATSTACQRAMAVAADLYPEPVIGGLLRLDRKEHLC